MEKSTYIKLNKFFADSPSVAEGIKDLLAKACDNKSGASIEEILRSIQDVVNELDAFFTADPAGYGNPDEMK